LLLCAIKRQIVRDFCRFSVSVTSKHVVTPALLLAPKHTMALSQMSLTFSRECMPSHQLVFGARGDSPLSDWLQRQQRPAPAASRSFDQQRQSRERQIENVCGPRCTTRRPRKSLEDQRQAQEPAPSPSGVRISTDDIF